MHPNPAARPAPDFQLLFEASPHPYLILAPDAAFTIVAVNDRYLAATGTRREDIVGHGLFEIFPDNPADAAGSGVPDLHASLDRVLSDRCQDIMGVQKYDIPLRDGSGGFEVRYWSPVNSPAFGPDGGIAYLIHHVEDVTEFIRRGERATRETAEVVAHADRMEAEVMRRAAELKDANRALKTALAELERREAELARLNERLQELDRVKTAFFANVSHELRTPLTLILGPAARWLAADGLPADLRRDLDMIKRNARQLYRHVTDILDVAKFDAGRMQLRYAQADLGELVRFVASHFEVLATEQGYHFEVAVSAHAPVELDVEKVQRILFNLLSNAFKFTPPGGGAIALTAGVADDRVTLCVQDNGPGIPADFRAAVFEPFRQGDMDADRHFGGTGLGLAIVMDFVVLHGGGVAASEAPGGGARITVTLPAAAPPGTVVEQSAAYLDARIGRQIAEELRPQRREAAPPIAAADAPLILVVEDNADMNAYVGRALEGRYRVASAFDGEAGLEYARTLAPDLIVADVMMPGMSGEVLVARLREQGETREIPIVMLTAKADDALRVKLLQQGVSDYLHKPFDVAELLARIDGILAERGRSVAHRRESDARVADALHRLDAHLGNSPLAIVEFDPTFRVMRWSKVAERLFGWSAAEMLGRAIAELRWVHDEDIEAVSWISAEMLAGRSPRNQSCNRNYRKDGTVVHCEWYNSALYAADGQLVSILSQVLDVSERQHALAELSAAKEAAEHANRAKSIFLANMSHEIRTPLHVIVGLGHLLRRDLADPVLLQRVDQLCAHSDHLLALLNDVLDLAKVEADRLVLDDEAFSLGSVAERVLEVVGRPAQEKGLAVVVDVAPALSDAVLRGDGLRLAQILINLGSNAVKFTERGTVRLEIVARAEDAQRMTLEFAVADTGIGLAAADQARLFQVFSQVDDSATRRHGGSGLGLAISQRLAALMGGRIDVVSTPGRGSRFAFALTLPRAAGLPEATPSPAADLVGRRVLFAEDHPLPQDILFEMLDDLGCDVEVASDGAEAVECAQVRDYDLILMDMQMPKLDGLEATRAIRALPRHRDTPIVALTANAFAEDRRRCLDAGMNGHLGKPVTPASLAAALGQWLGAMRSPAASRAVASPEMMARFIAEQRQTLPCLRAHLVAGERDPAYVLAHNLKGIAGLLDVRRMAELADDLAQRLCGGADPASLVPLADACAAELQELVAAPGDLPQA